MDEETPLTEHLLRVQQEEEQQQDKNYVPIVLQASAESNDAQDPMTSGSDPIPPSEAVDQTWDRGEMQPTKFRDLPYAILFLSQFLFILSYTPSLVRFMNTKEGNQHDDDDDMLPTANEIARIFLTNVAPALPFSIFYIYLSFVVLTKMGTAFITYSLWTNVVVSVICAIAGFVLGQIMVGVMCTLSALIGTCYVIAVRSRIPFAAANLDVGVTAIKSNLGVFLVPLVSGFMVVIYTALWTFSLVEVTGLNMKEDQEGDLHVDIARPGWIYPWVLFLFWTLQVSQAGVHTIVAGLVATWYFDPAEASGCCSNAVSGSTRRALTSSFGSICLGSLLVAIVQFLDWIVRSARQNRAERGERGGFDALFLCCLDCILQVLEDLLQYFNQWAFIYVAIYGYPYRIAGKKVMTLFEQRGWTIIINDNLVSNALGLLSFIIALLIGITSVLFINLTSKDEGDDQYIFWGNFFTGLILAVTTMGILNSSVKTVILCFAEAPHELERNHGALSRKMREAWNKVYPMINC